MRPGFLGSGTWLICQLDRINANGAGRVVPRVKRAKEMLFIKNLETIYWNIEYLRNRVKIEKYDVTQQIFSRDLKVVFVDYHLVHFVRDLKVVLAQQNFVPDLKVGFVDSQ